MASRRAKYGHVCPPDHTHGMNLTCHGKHRCECDECAMARHQYDRSSRLLAGGSVMIDSAPTMRRLQAMARHGWTAPAIAALTGQDRNTITGLRLGRRPTVRVSTAEPIVEVYAKHAMTVLDGLTADRARRVAREAGWRWPAEWADIERGILD